MGLVYCARIFYLFEKMGQSHHNGAMSTPVHFIDAWLNPHEKNFYDKMLHISCS